MFSNAGNPSLRSHRQAASSILEGRCWQPAEDSPHPSLGLTFPAAQERGLGRASGPRPKMRSSERGQQ